ncbi:Haloalkane dehalogenase [Frondihabitans sp. 762G35]|uniref:esterase/lipase family protein n=1 Tax=Frondihabitans sp. 762G35 TaxID=1446794 RepID=UPI000D210C9A|nr:alpha/beta hydrolase [Frondihabitans sp. 762G35]ARC56503.1 Haloalkane dehalogenase [Frondihabitans sp. 762G35]
MTVPHLPRVPFLSGGPRGGVRHYLRMLPPDYAYSARTHLRSLLGTSVPRVYREGAKAPILLLPGVYESWRTLRWFADVMNRDGHPVVVVPGLAHNRRPIADTAVLAQRILDANDLRDVVILAHSKGGIIGKSMMLDTDASGRIARMVAVNSPFQGSRMARYIPTRAFRAFLPTDPLLTRLTAEQEVNARITSVFSDFDGHVPEGSVLPGARNVTVPVDGHFRPLGHPVGRAMILAALAG